MPKGHHVSFGPVKIVRGAFRGRIGYYDDDDTDFGDIDWSSIPNDQEVKGREVAVVYFGDFFLADGYYTIPPAYLRPVTIDDLMKRREALHDLCGLAAEVKYPELANDYEKKYEYLAELHYIDSVLVDRMTEARYSKVERGVKTFISHSSQDKTFARWIGADLKAAGHAPWFDEWNIQVGESIPQRISEGLRDSEFVVVVLSEHSVGSKWVEREWQAKYWDEIQQNKISVLPLLLRDCEIPELLKTKKYANFRDNYNNGLEDLLAAINTLSAAKPKRPKSTTVRHTGKAPESPRRRSQAPPVEER